MMKKTILSLGMAAFFVAGSATFMGCGNSENHEDESHEHAEDMHEEHVDHAEYQCPMKCEGDKTYDEAGECPKCGMDLKEVE